MFVGDFVDKTVGTGAANGVHVGLGVFKIGEIVKEFLGRFDVLTKGETCSGIAVAQSSHQCGQFR